MAERDSGEAVTVQVHSWRDHVLLLRRCRNATVRIAANLPPKQADIDELNTVVRELETISREKGKLAQEIEAFKKGFWQLRDAMFRVGTYIPERRLHRLIDEESNLEAIAPDEMELTVSPAERHDVEEVIDMLLNQVHTDSLVEEAAEAMLIRFFFSVRKRIFHVGWHDPSLEVDLKNLLRRHSNLETHASAPADRRP